MTGKALMLQGTGSDVGKSVLTAALCRIAKRRGLSVAPFKPQNMSNNAMACADGGEIGRAQALQARAAGIEPSTDMTPVLLKPQSDRAAQIVLQGKALTTMEAMDYMAQRASLMGAVMQSFSRLAETHDLVLVEGAGSPAEVNLRERDIANMGFARHANVPVCLIGDIDKGGVIASLVGTHAILPEADRASIAGYLINKFRGDVSLFDDGLTAIERFTGWRSFGVVPWLSMASRLPAEDSGAREKGIDTGGDGATVIVPVLSRIANFDDLDPLRLQPGVRLVFVRPGDAWPTDAKLVVLPGSKSTIADLEQFRALGWDKRLAQHVEQGGYVLGICGGYQILGHVVRDPDGIEGTQQAAQGLGLLDVETTLVPHKTVLNRKATDSATGIALDGYEIHMGRTIGPATAKAMVKLDDTPDGACSADGRVRGCYLHGLFATDEWRVDYLRSVGIDVPATDYRAGVQSALDELADALEDVIDPAIFEL